MTAPNLPVVRYRTAKVRDQALHSLAQSGAPSHRAILTLGPMVSARTFTHRLVTKDSTAVLARARLKGLDTQPDSAG